MSDPATTERVVVVERKGNGLAVAALVLGIVGVVFGLIPILFFIAFVCGILAVIFGAVAWRAVAREPERGRKGMAIAGTILGVVAIVLGGVGVAIVGEAVDDVNTELERLQEDLNQP